MFEKVELNNRATLYKGDNAFVLPQLEDNSIDAIITDPPAGIAFMRKDWDKNKGGRDAWIAWMKEVATQCLRIIKPGGHALVWAIPRTSHWTATAWENAGWEVRDKVYHAFASGFPKGLNIGKAIDRHLGAEREVVGINEDRARRQPNGLYTNGRQTYMLSVNKFAGNHNVTAAATPQSQQWEGWNTTLKPAIEEWIMFRKPTEGTVVENVLRHGVGGINIDACRIPTQEYLGRPKGQAVNAYNMSRYPEPALGEITSEPEARYPTNLIHDGSDEVVEMFPVTTSSSSTKKRTTPHAGGNGKTMGIGWNGEVTEIGYGDSGSAARFFASFPLDGQCSLCYNPLCNDTNKENELWKKLFALYAGKNGWTSLAISECIARMSVVGSQNESLVHSVKSAGNLCDLCATSIAVALVGIKTSVFNEKELQVILGYTGSCNASILIQNLASFAELWVNTDTIPTMTSLSILFGSVNHAITSYTREIEKSALSRLIYQPKASKHDRDEGLEEFDKKVIKITSGHGRGEINTNKQNGTGIRDNFPRHNTHATVKPISLMQYLCRLITPPNGIIIDPFMGSGSTGKAAMLEGFRFIGIEKENEYFEIAQARILWVYNKEKQGRLF